MEKVQVIMQAAEFWTNYGGDLDVTQIGESYSNQCVK